MMTVEQAIEYIHSVFWKGSIPGLERISELLEKMSFVRMGGTDEEMAAANILMDEIRAIGLEPVIEEFEIEDVKLNIPSNNQKFISRIKISLKSIGFNAITIADNDIKYDYAEQGDILEDILNKKE